MFADRQQKSSDSKVKAELAEAWPQSEYIPSMRQVQASLRSIPFIIVFLLVLTACERPSAEPQFAVINAPNQPVANLTATPTLAPTKNATENPQLLPTATTIPPTNTPVFTPTPFYTGELSAPCGLSLPILPTNVEPTDTAVTENEALVVQIQSTIPDTALPALQRLLAAPESVGLVAYRMGDEANGIYWNADTQMPLASVSKLIHLVAYAEAAAAGQIDPTSIVTVEDIERYYLRGYDLGAHNRALNELAAQERLLDNPARMQLEDVPWMMTRFSSNAATDYIHMLLGQARIEQTAVSLNLTQQTAPCTWIGQFMAMGNHTRQGFSDRQAVLGYVEDPAQYGADVALFTDAYSGEDSFRTEESNWHAQTRRPSVETQRLFSHQLNAHGTPREYADLMARIAQNGLSNPDSSFLARRYLEWPMIFLDNQDYFSNLGYKNGQLPGIVTTVYYAYPKGDTAPLVVVLFYRDLPQRTYRQWRRDVWPDDEFARWLLIDEQAIPLLRALLN